jgi:hypothetical protein
MQTKFAERSEIITKLLLLLGAQFGDRIQLHNASHYETFKSHSHLKVT